MPNFTPTAEQLACVAAATDTNDNLIISALAGAAKTATLVLIADALAPKDILCLAFNKRIAVEMTERLPANCKSSTLNALGHRIWADMLGTRLRVDMKKMYNLVSGKIKNMPNGKAQDEMWKGFKELLSTAKEAKSAGYVPEAALEKFQKHRPKPLIDEHHFYEVCEFDLTPSERTFVDEVILLSIEESFAGSIDFDDQIYMPACFRAVFPIHSIVMVDEAQDLSSLNHRFLKKLARQRLIAVGDPCQAIYGFRGAHEESMSLMKQDFNMRTLTLTTSFRCPEAIIDHVRWRAPEMKSWADHPEEGKVNHLPYWSVNDIPDNAAVICRNNAPLYRMAITFLREGRTPKMANNDIGKALIGIMKKLGATNLKKDDAIHEVRQWLWEKERRSRAKRTSRDQAECMIVFLEATETLGQAIHFATELLAYQGAVEFMTGHKSKGLEFPDVYFLDQQLVRDEGQDPNLRYVICTRATRSLSYIRTEDCAEIETEEELE